MVESSKSAWESRSTVVNQHLFLTFQFKFSTILMSYSIAFNPRICWKFYYLNNTHNDWVRKVCNYNLQNEKIIRNSYSREFLIKRHEFKRIFNRENEQCMVRNWNWFGNRIPNRNFQRVLICKCWSLVFLLLMSLTCLHDFGAIAMSNQRWFFFAMKIVK